MRKPGSRVLHTFAVVAVGLGAWVALGVMAFSVVVTKVEGRTLVGYHFWLAGLALAAWGVAILGAKAIRGGVKWGWLAVEASCVAGMIAFLAHDDAPLGLPDLGLRGGEDDPGYQTIMWLSEKLPHSRLREAGVLDWESRELLLPTKREDWTKHVEEKRGAILSAWEADRVGRQWVAGVSANPPTGVWLLELGDPAVSFKAVRVVMSVRLARAFMIAREGRRDEALASVTELIRAMQVIERTSAGLIHPMIATVVLKQCYRMCDAIVEMGAVAERERTELMDGLRSSPPIKHVIMQALLGEQVFAREVFKTLRFPTGSLGIPIEERRWLELGISLGGRKILLNANSSERQVARRWNELMAHADARNVEEINGTQAAWDSGSPLKNPVGRLMSQMLMPEMKGAVRNFWAAEDERLALLARLEGR